MFDAWACHDTNGNFVESIPNGPMSRFFEQAHRAGHETSRYTQIFTMASDRDRDFDATIDGIRSVMKAICLPVFYFEGGRILLLASTEPGKVSVSRCQTALSRLGSWAIRDASGETLSNGGSDDDLWELVNLDELYFGDEE